MSINRPVVSYMKIFSIACSPNCIRVGYAFELRNCAADSKSVSVTFKGDSSKVLVRPMPCYSAPYKEAHFVSVVWKKT